jgi:hypothetical protein
MGNSSVSTLPETEGVPTHKVSTLTVGVVQGVEEERGGWAQKVLNVLLKSVDVLARWVLGNLQDKQRHSVSVKKLSRRRIITIWSHCKDDMFANVWIRSHYWWYNSLKL